MIHRLRLSTRLPKVAGSLFFALALSAVWAQRQANIEGREATVVENSKLELQVLNRGGAFASITLKDDPQHQNPLWNPAAIAREHKIPARFGDSIGHFVCVDGFGPSSKEEQAAGLNGHGEAHRQPWERVSATNADGVQQITWRANLPLVQETFTRRVELVEGEQVVYVDSTLESQTAFDRPANWAEHATIGYPFLKPEVTVVDASVGRCQTRPHQNIPRNRTLLGGQEFTYPIAPLQAGGTRNLRSVPSKPDSMDHTGCAVDPTRRLEFVTAINTESRLMLGYLYRREDYPWLQEWLNYPANLALTRGLEFGTQPYDVSRRQTVEMGTLFGVPTFKWLPAKSKLSTRFLMFLTRVPAGFTKVDDVRQENGQLIIEDRQSKQSVMLKASRPL